MPTLPPPAHLGPPPAGDMIYYRCDIKQAAIISRPVVLSPQGHQRQIDLLTIDGERSGSHSLTGVLIIPGGNYTCCFLGKLPSRLVILR